MRKENTSGDASTGKNLSKGQNKEPGAALLLNTSTRKWAESLHMISSDPLLPVGESVPVYSLSEGHAGNKGGKVICISWRDSMARRDSIVCEHQVHQSIGLPFFSFILRAELSLSLHIHAHTRLLFSSLLIPT